MHSFFCGKHTIYRELSFALYLSLGQVSFFYVSGGKVVKFLKELVCVACLSRYYLFLLCVYSLISIPCTLPSLSPIAICSCLKRQRFVLHVVCFHFPLLTGDKLAAYKKFCFSLSPILLISLFNILSILFSLVFVFLFLLAKLACSYPFIILLLFVACSLFSWAIYLARYRFAFFLFLALLISL